MMLIVPASTTRSGCSGTVTVQLWVAPLASVSVIVAVPEPAAVIRPLSLTRATASSDVLNWQPSKDTPSALAL